MAKLSECLKIHLNDPSDQFIVDMIKAQAKALSSKGRLSNAVARQAVNDIIAEFSKDSERIQAQLQQSAPKAPPEVRTEPGVPAVTEKVEPKADQLPVDTEKVEGQKEQSEQNTLQPGAAVTWKNKKGEMISGKLISEDNKNVYVEKPDGKKTYVNKKDLVVPETSANSAGKTPAVIEKPEPKNADHPDALKNSEIGQRAQEQYAGWKGKDIISAQTATRTADISQAKFSTNQDIIPSEAKIADFIKRSLAGENLPNLSIGKVSQEHAKKIKELTGKSVAGFSHELVSQELRHARNTHGDPKKEILRNQIAITEKDFNRIPEIIKNPDNIVKGTDRRKGEKSVRFIKRFNGELIYVEVIHTKGSLQSMTLWKRPSAGADATLKASSDDTSETASSPSLTDNNILTESDSVKKDLISDATNKDALSVPDVVLPGKKGKSGKVYTNDNTPVDFTYQITPLESLIPSHDDSMNVNPAYPKELQPRDRSRAMSSVQIDNMASKLNPERLGESNIVAHGAPIVLPNGTVLSGNGRVLALKKAAKDGGLDKYSEYLRQNSEKFGTDGDGVLVRVVDQKSIGDPVLFVQKANESDLAKMSATEQATVDAGNLSEDDMAIFRPSEDGDLAASSNRVFLERFVQKMSPEERSGYLTEDGSPSRQLIDRVQQAIFQKAYGSESILKMVAEEANPDIKNILNGLRVGARDFARSGTMNPEMTETLVSPILEAVEFIRKAQSENKDIKGGIQAQVRQALSQMDMFGNALSYQGKIIIEYIAQNIRSSKRIGELIKEIGKLHRKTLAEINQQSIFGDDGPQESIIETVINRLENKYAQDTTTLFDQGSADKVSKSPSERSESRDGQKTGQREEQVVGQVFNAEKNVSEPAGKYKAAKEKYGDILNEKPEQMYLFEADPKEVQKIEPSGLRTKQEVSTRFVNGRVNNRGPANIIETADDAASFLSHTVDNAQEKVYFIATDKAGKVLEVLQHSVGTKNSATLDSMTAMGRVFNLKDVSNVYFVHNHPGGNPKPSVPDTQAVKKIIQKAKLRKIGITSMILAGNDFTIFDTSGVISSGPIRQSVKQAFFPEKERFIKKKLTDKVSIATRDLAEARLKNEGDGFLLLNASNNEVGFLPFPSGLPEREITARLLAAVEKTNADSIIINNKPPVNMKARKGFLNRLSDALLVENIFVFDVLEYGNGSQIFHDVQDQKRKPKNDIEAVDRDDIRFQTSGDLKRSIVSELTGTEIQPEPSESLFNAAKRYFKEKLQGNIVERKGLGPVRVTGKGWNKTKRGLKDDPIRIQIIPALPDVIQKGEYKGRFEAPGRKDGIIAFHHFWGNVRISGNTYLVGVSVGEDEFGNLFYNINRDPDRLLDNRKARLLPRLEARGGEPSIEDQSSDMNIDIKSDSVKDKFSTDHTPGQGVTIKDIQKRFKGQDVFMGTDGTISIRMKNGLGLIIEQVKAFGKDDIQIAMRGGRMGRNGVILGKYKDSKMSLNQFLADTITLDHENYHFLADHLLTQSDRDLILEKAKAYHVSDKFMFEWNDANMEENEANAFSQFLNEREAHRGTALGNVIQRFMDFIDGLLHIGRQSVGKLAREIESGKVYSRNDIGNGSQVQRFMFAGPSAKGADMGKTFETQQMRDAGISRKEVWDKTGWWEIIPGSDVWSFELDDSKVKWIKAFSDSHQYGILGDFITAPDLIRSYPWLKDVLTTVTIDKDIKDVGGKHIPAENREAEGLFDIEQEIRVTATSIEEARSLVLHEIQHAIQTHEGFARGGNPNFFAHGPMFSEEANRLTMELFQATTGEVKTDVQELVDNLPYADADKLTRIAKQHGFDNLESAMLFLKTENKKRTPYGQYARLTGEAQARLTQRRIKMTAEQRKAEVPWITLKYMMWEEGLLTDLNQKPEDVLISRYDTEVLYRSESDDHKNIDPFKANSGEIRNFKEHLDKFLRKELNPKELIPVCDTPEVIKAIGAKELPITITQNVLEKVVFGKHADELYLKDLEKLPEKLADPIAIVKSESPAGNSIIVVLEMKDRNGNSVIVPIYLDQKHGRLSINAIASVYGKEGRAWFQEQVDNGRLLFINKKKSQDWDMKGGGLLLPPMRGSNIGLSDNKILTEKDIVKKNVQPFIQGTWDKNNSGIRFSTSSDRRGPGDPMSALPEHVQERYKKSKGVDHTSFLDKAKQIFGKLKEQTAHFPELTRVKDEKQRAIFKEQLRQHQEIPSVAQDKAARAIHGFISGMTKEEYDLYSMRLILGDEIANLDDGKRSEDNLPFGFKSANELRDSYRRINQMVAASPKVKNALEARQEFQHQLAKRLVDHKILGDDVLKSKEYFHHQVLQYWNLKERALKGLGTGSKDARSSWRPWMAKRKDSPLDYNTEYVEAELMATAQMISQADTADSLKKIRVDSDILPDLKRTAKAANDKMLNDMVAELAKAGKWNLDEFRQPEDPLKAFKQKIAIGFSQLQTKAKDGSLDYGKGFEDVIAALADGDTSHPQIWQFLTDQLNNKRSGAMQAATIYKYIKARDKFIKEFLGKNFKTAEGMIPEGYVKWEPKKNTGWFKINTIADNILEKVLSGEKTLQDDDVKQILAKGRPTFWVIPEGLADTMDNFRPVSADFALGKLSGNIMTAWKQYILLNPLSALKYNMNNMSGDADIVMAFDPKILTYSKQAFSDIRKWMKYGHNPELDIARDKGVIGSGFAVQEVEDTIQVLGVNKVVDEIMLGKNARLTAKYWAKIKGLSTLRENMLRLAAYRYFKDQHKKGIVETYGASKPAEIKALLGNGMADDAAAKMARELLGDYGAISRHGEMLRKHLIPFWSWSEINLSRYIYLLRNLREEGGTATGGAAAVAGILAKRGAVFALKAALFAGAVALFNMTVWPDEEEELGESARGQQHLILGRRKDGGIITMRLEGALSSALSWFGMEDLLSDIKDVNKGTASLADKGKEMGKALVNKMAQGVRPDAKTLAELAFGKKAYPDVFSPRPIRDNIEHALGTVKLQMPYQWAAGKPKQGGSVSEQLMNNLASVATYSVEPGVQAYYDTRSLVYDWKRKNGQELPGFEPKDKSNALYYYKQAVRFGDLKAADKYHKQYIELGGTKQGMKKSITNAHPLAGIKNADRSKFMKTLTPAQGERLKKAIKWHQSTYLMKKIQ